MINMTLFYSAVTNTKSGRVKSALSNVVSLVKKSDVKITTSSRKDRPFHNIRDSKSGERGQQDLWGLELSIDVFQVPKFVNCRCRF